MRKEQTLHDLLSDNLLRILRRSRIRERKDFRRLKGIHPSGFFQPLQQHFSELPFISSVVFSCCPHTPASSFFDLRFRGRKLGGISIHVSHIASIFCCHFEPPEGCLPLPWEASPEVLREAIRVYHKALKRKPPTKAVLLGERVLDEMTARGFMHIPKAELERVPARQSRLPKSLRRYSLAFFYFQCIPLFDEERLRRLMAKSNARSGLTQDEARVKIPA